jgi:uncharacterized membrane protein
MRKFKSDKGVAGLDILLSVIIMLFTIGFIVMIFAIMGGQVEDATYVDVTGSVNNETTTLVVGDVYQTFPTVNVLRSPTCTFVYATNSSTVDIIEEGNYTVSNCQIKFTGDAGVGNDNWNQTKYNVTYTYTATSNSTASDVAFTTTTEIVQVSDWFGIIIVITAMVVLILLTVIIISAIRGSGTMGMGSNAPKETA